MKNIENYKLYTEFKEKYKHLFKIEGIELLKFNI